jgi:glycosyltransferase involved in cell wall biosynthesis
VLQYALITPAHNEESHLRLTIDSIQKQILKPIRWIIVDDGSSDKTRSIAELASSEMDFVRVITMSRSGGRSFGNKARAFNLGVEQLSGVSYDVIGNLDADVSFAPSYFAHLVKAFERDESLGITGGIVFTNIGGRFVTQDRTTDTVAGAVQLFRRECFEEIGGRYLPLPSGGIDAAAEIIAKSKGWKVRKSFTDPVSEHRQTGTASATPVVALFRLGRRFRALGYGPLFFSARCLYRVRDEPVLIGSCAQFCGFIAAFVRREPIILPPEVVKYLRQMQRRRLMRLAVPSLRPSSSQTEPHVDGQTPT